MTVPAGGTLNYVRITGLTGFTEKLTERENDEGLYKVFLRVFKCLAFPRTHMEAKSVAHNAILHQNFF